MSKRFTDTDKYKKDFIRGLPGPYKLLWDYLYHDCDHAGIWHKDFQIAQIYIGQDMPINEKEALELFNKNEQRIIVLDGGKKWFIPPFVAFQYGELNPENRLHQSVLTLLKKNGIKDLGRPLEGPKDKDKNKDKEKDKEKEGGVGETIKRPLTDLQKVVKGWKFLKGVPIEGDESKSWDRAHFARCSKSASQLLDLFGYPGAVHAMEYVFNWLESKKLDCTLETIVKHSDKYREVMDRGNGNGQGNASLPVIRDAIKTITRA